MNFLFVGTAGFLGATLRVLIGEIMYDFFPNLEFPYHTLLINLLGSFLFAYLFMFLKTRMIKISPKLKLAIFTGFLGSFTTFSTFSIETLTLVQNGKFSLAISYILLSFFGGITLTFLGLRFGRYKIKSYKKEATLWESKR